MTDTPVSRTLAATFSELTDLPTPTEYRVLVPTTAAPIIGMTETHPSSIASFESPPIVTATLEASTTETATVVAPPPIETVLEPQG